MPKAKFTEQGNGLPTRGDYVTDGDSIYRVVTVAMDIHTNGLRGNYTFGQVAEADWYECGESAMHDALVEIEEN